jgi:hypothetical protein
MDNKVIDVYIGAKSWAALNLADPHIAGCPVRLRTTGFRTSSTHEVDCSARGSQTSANLGGRPIAES